MLTPGASDPDGDPLTFAATGLPAGVTIHPTTGAISGTPTSLGDHAVYVSVSDPSGAAATQHFHWSILDDRRVVTPRIGAAIEGDVAAVALTLDRASAHPITVDWATVPTTGSPVGVAASDIDFAAASGTVTFLPGEVSVTVPVVTLEDGLNESPLLYLSLIHI